MNGLFRWGHRSRPILNWAELLTIYTCISVGSSLAGVDRMMVMVPLIGHAHWFATPENDWINLFHCYIPTWLSISDKHVLKGYYQGFRLSTAAPIYPLGYPSFFGGVCFSLSFTW